MTGLEWRFPGAAGKAHLFPLGNGESLCGRWLYFGPAQGDDLGDKPGPHDCVACWRVARKREAL